MKNLVMLMMGLLLLGACQLLAQSIPEAPNKTNSNGTPEGKWILWKDKAWNLTRNNDSVAFYREITFDNGVPVGVVKDYYRNGKLQMEGTLLASDPKNPQGDVKDGTFTYFNEKGIKQSVNEFKNSIKISTTDYNPDGTENRWLTLDHMGRLYFDKRDYRSAQKYWEEALGQAEKEFGKQDENYVTSLYAAAEVYTWLGWYDKSEPLCQQALEIRKNERGDDHPDYASSLNRLAELYDLMGKYDKEETLLIQAIQIGRDHLGENNAGYAHYLDNLGSLYTTLGRYEKAEPLILKGLMIRKAQLGNKHFYYARSLNHLAILYMAMGRYEKAEPLYQEAMELNKTMGGAHSYYYTNSINNLARLYWVMGKYKKSEGLYKDAVRINKEIGGGKEGFYASSVGALAGLYVSMGRYELAEPLFQEALDIRKSTIGENHPFYAMSLNGLAELYFATGKYSISQPLYAKALEIRKNQLGEDHPDYAYTLLSMAILYESTNHLKEAESLFIHDNENLRRQIERYFPSLSDSEKEQFYNTVKNRFEAFQAYGLLAYSQNSKIAVEMFNMQLATKGLLLNSSAKWKQRIRSSGDKKLFSLYSVWEEQQAVLAKLYKDSNPQKKKMRDSLQIQSNSLEKELTQRSEFFAQLSDKKRYTWHDVQQKLKADEAAIEIVRVRKFGMTKVVVDSSSTTLARYPQHGLTDTVYYAALIVKQSSKQPTLVILKNGNELEKRQLSYYRNSITAQKRDDLSYNQFWRPIAAALGRKIKRVYVSPDGVYNSINLNALYNPKTKRYILNETDLQMLTTTKDLLATRSDEKYNNLAYLFGFPDYQLSQERRAALVQKERDAHPSYYSLTLERGTELSDLPGTRTEVESIAAMLAKGGWQPELFTGDKALEETIKDSFKPRVLHIATHGYFRPDSLLSLRSNPLLQSGLMLAGAGRTLAGDKDERTEDGILTAYEAMNLNLDNTDLVVLSACETGLGEIRNGEGVYGLQRAFKVAGAKSIIMSLWKVNDESTQRLLTLFYKYWLESGNKREAFKKAQVSIQASYTSPYFWGPFIMVGE